MNHAFQITRKQIQPKFCKTMATSITHKVNKGTSFEIQYH